MAIRPITRVLIIDNDPRVGPDLEAMLEPLGYRVEIARGAGRDLLDQVVAHASRFRPHVAVVDMRLLDEHSDDRSGLALLEHLRSARCILYSAYLKPEVTREARHYASSWVSKSESPQRLLDAIADAARDIRAGSKRLTIHRPAVWTSKRIVQTLFGDDVDVPPEVVEDVLSQLFSTSENITLETLEGAVITPGSVTRGRSVVLKVWLDNKRAPLVAKLAPSEHIIEESSNYFKHIKGNLRGLFHAILEGDYVAFWDLGSVLYTFVGAPRESLPSFARFYREQHQPQVILQPLRHLFAEVWIDLYKGATELKQSLFCVYDRVLRLEKRLQDFPRKERQWAFSGVPVPMLNPVLWVLRHRDDSAIPHTCQAITHGDLHGDNLFVDESHAWAIDFERSGPGPILRDFVELEIDIVTRLVPFSENDLSRLYEFAVVLAEPEDPTAPLQPTDHLQSDPQICKALGVISGLRELAHEITGYRDSREYLWGLLLDALFVASLASEQSIQRERALLLGSVLCGRLRHWGKEWPPEDWPPITENRVRSQLHDSRATERKGAPYMSHRFP